MDGQFPHHHVVPLFPVGKLQRGGAGESATFAQPLEFLERLGARFQVVGLVVADQGDQKRRWPARQSHGCRKRLQGAFAHVAGSGQNQAHGSGGFPAQFQGERPLGKAGATLALLFQEFAQESPVAVVFEQPPDRRVGLRLGLFHDPFPGFTSKALKLFEGWFEDNTDPGRRAVGLRMRKRDPFPRTPPIGQIPSLQGFRRFACYLALAPQTLVPFSQSSIQGFSLGLEFQL